MKKILLKILNPIIGNIHLQSLFKSLNLFSLIGMNYGLGTNFKDSGELYVLNFISKKIRQKSVVIFDVGANMGNYTKNVLRIFENKKIKVYAFEPAKDTFKKLKNNLNDDQKVHIYELGLSNKEGSAYLFSTRTESGLSSLYQRNLKHIKKTLETSQLIRLETIDSFCAKKHIRNINLLKLDIEGHELTALEGATKMIKKNKIDFIQFEFGGCNIDSKTYFKDFYYLLKPNFDIYRIMKNGLYRIKKYEETLEVFITTNYLAIRK